MNKTTEVFEFFDSNYSSTCVERALKLALGEKEYAEEMKRLEGEFYFATPHSRTNCEHCGCDLPNHYAGCSAIAYPFGSEA